MRFPAAPMIAFSAIVFNSIVALDHKENISYAFDEQRISQYLCIGDPEGALKELEGKELSSEVIQGKIRALFALKREKEALALFRELRKEDPKRAIEHSFLEEIAWGVLKKALDSSQTTLKQAALVGAVLSRDAKAIPCLMKMLQSSSAFHRSFALQMVSHFGDAPLKREVSRMLKEEKVWSVRLAAIQAAGKLRIKEEKQRLHQLIQSVSVLDEEKPVALTALLGIYDTVNRDDLMQLIHSPRAALREFGCLLVDHYALTEVYNEIEPLLHDAHPQVRMAALQLFGKRKSEELGPEIQNGLDQAVSDAHPLVAMLADWADYKYHPERSIAALRTWCEDPSLENQRFAASVINALGASGLALSQEVLRTSQDPYVRANLAIGLLRQRVALPLAVQEVHSFLKQDTGLWMWDASPYPLFRRLVPSTARQQESIPNYPRILDQMVRLEVLSLLCFVEDPEALEAIQECFQEKARGIVFHTSLKVLSEAPEIAFEQMRELLNHPDSWVRLQAGLALAFYAKDPTALPHLHAAYKTADREQRLLLLEALGTLASPESLSFFLDVLEDSFPLPRICAASAILQILRT